MGESAYVPRPSYDPQELLNAQPVMISVVDPDTYTVQFQNETGLKKFGDLSGQTCYEKIAGCAAPCTFCKMPEAVSSGAITTSEVMLPNQQWLLVQWSKAVTADGRLHVIETITDVTERKRLEDAAHKAEKMESLSRLAGWVAHDLNNLLTVITAASEQVFRQLAGHLQNQASIRQIQDAVGRAADLTHNLVAFSHHQVVETAVLDVNRILREMEPKIRRLAGNRVTTTLALAGECGAVVMARQQIEDMVRHLVANARDAMPCGGTLTIATSLRYVTALAGQEHAVKAGRYVEIAVRDTGCGIEPAMQVHLFEPFYSRGRVRTGRGLGLASLYGIVRQIGGFIEVSSTQGAGSLFEICLPRSDHAQVEQCANDQPEKVSEPGAILLVEDNEDVRLAVGDMLRGAGYRVYEAADGIDALRIVDDSAVHPQLVLSDVMMPRMTGPQLAARIHTSMPAAKMLYMSAYSEGALESVSGERLAFIPKPFNSSELIRKVRETLAS